MTPADLTEVDHTRVWIVTACSAVRESWESGLAWAREHGGNRLPFQWRTKEAEMLIAYCEGAELAELCKGWGEFGYRVGTISMLAFRGLLSPRDEDGWPIITNTGFQEADALIAGERHIMASLS